MGKSENQTPTDQLIEVQQILDSCLTEETLKRLAPDVTVFSNLNGENVRRELFIHLLEYAGNEVMSRLNRELLPGEVILTFNRIRQFLRARRLY